MKRLCKISIKVLLLLNIIIVLNILFFNMFSYADAIFSNYCDCFSIDDNANKIFIEDGYYCIETKIDSNYVLDVAGAGFARGANVQLYEKNNTEAQKWKIINKDGGILIANVNSGLVLDVYSGLTYSGNNVQTFYTNHTLSQLWYPKSFNNGIVLVSALNNNFVLDINGGLAYNNNNVQLYLENDSSAQVFIFKKMDKPQYDIPSFNIELNGYSLDQINSGNKETKYPGNKMTLDSGSSEEEFSNVQIKGRGNTTWDAPKKPYAIKLDSKENLLDLGKAKNWVLLACWFDDTKIHNDLAFYIGRELNLKYTFNGKFVNLYVDNEYVGLYWLTHKVEIGKSTVDISDDGILVEMDARQPDKGDLYFWDSITNTNIVLKDYNESSPYEDLFFCIFKEKWLKFEEAINNKDINAIDKVVDLESLADYLIISDFTYNHDAFWASTFIYMDGADDKIHFGPLWDFDLAFGTSPFCDNDPCRRFPNLENSYTMKAMLMDVQNLANLVMDEYKNIKSNKNMIFERMNCLYSLCNESFNKDSNKWNKLNINNAMTYMNNYINKRFNYLDILYTNHVVLDDGYYQINGNGSCFNNGIYKIKNNDDGTCCIINTDNGKCLDVSANSYSLNAPVGYYEINNTDAQKWFVSKVNDRYCFIAKISRFCLDINGFMHLYDMNLTNNQLFTIKSSNLPIFDFDSTKQYEIVSSLDNKIGISKTGTNVLTGYANSIYSPAFNLNKNIDGTYSIVDRATNLVVGIQPNSWSNASNIELSLNKGLESQKWIPRKNLDGSCTFISPACWKCIDISAGSKLVGTNIQLYEINNSNAQKWCFKAPAKDEIYELAKKNANTIKNGIYCINSAIDQNFVLDVQSGSLSDSANVQLYRYNSTNAQKWMITNDADGFITIKNIQSNKYLDVCGAVPSCGSNIQQYHGNSTFAQKWIAIKTNTGVKIVSALSANLVLDLFAGQVVDGSNIQLYNNNESLAQRWLFKKFE